MEKIITYLKANGDKQEEIGDKEIERQIMKYRTLNDVNKAFGIQTKNEEILEASFSD